LEEPATLVGYGSEGVGLGVWGAGWEGVSRGLKPLDSRWTVMPGLKSGPTSEAKATTGESVLRGCGGATDSWRGARDGWASGQLEIGSVT
jgi:hypothetical protein